MRTVHARHRIHGVCSLLVLFVTYLLIGTLYNRFVRGARGWEQIPNADSWGSCFGLIFVRVRCVWAPVTRRRTASTGC